MKYTKAEATILLAGVRKSIEKKWEPLTSGKFRGRVEPAYALCVAYKKAHDLERDGDTDEWWYDGCDHCVLIDSQGRGCSEDRHAYWRWFNKLEDFMFDNDMSFRRAANQPAVVKAAGRVLTSLRRAEARLVKIGGTV